jgi:hypothetical protein
LQPTALGAILQEPVFDETLGVDLHEITHHAARQEARTRFRVFRVARRINAVGERDDGAASAQFGRGLLVENFLCNAFERVVERRAVACAE